MNFFQRSQVMHYSRLDQESTADSVNLSENTKEPLECLGYCRNFCKNALFHLWSVLSLGFPVLLIYWRPEWGLYWRHSRCRLEAADHVLLRQGRAKYTVSKVCMEAMAKCPSEFTDLIVPLSSNAVDDQAQLTSNQGLFYRYFEYQHVKYVWNQRLCHFQKLMGYDDCMACSEFYERFKGYTEEEQRQRSVIFGKNDINVDVKPYGQLLIQEIFNPFYVFQIFSIVLWAMDEYYYFAACIFVVSAVSISVSLYKTRKQSVILHSMVASSTASQVTVLQKDCVVDILASSVVPGDVLIIPPTGCIMTCDAVLVAGNCIVNESMLTGESVPITKTPLPFQDSEVFSTETHKRHTLFSGTKVIQTRYYGSNQVMAVVVRTGFNTAKGELIRSILYPKAVDFKFYRDSMKFIGVLAIIAVLGMTYGAVIFIRGQVSVVFILVRLLDVVTIAVPPSLPAAITVGSVHAQNRLRKKNVFCISPARINICGKLKLFCFDKTGTLTEEGLDFWGAIPAIGGSFQHVVTVAFELPQRSPYLAAMAACHSLTMIGGELTGDPLDIKMFEATKWEIEEPGLETTRFDQLAPIVVRPLPILSSHHCHPSTSRASFAQEVLLETETDHKRFDILVPTVVKPVTVDTYIDTSGFFSEGGVAETALKVPYEIGIVRQFPFSSSLQMMSVVARTLGRECMDLYAKGAPEKIISLCSSSSVPLDVNDLLHRYAVQGFRVIALAWRELDPRLTWHHVQRAKREEMERDLCFLGLLVMQNTLKPETTPVIRALTKAKIRSVMVTGDNMHTAISVARECCMVPAEHRIIILKAHPPEQDRPACIEWMTTELVSSDGERADSVNIPVDEKLPFYHFATDGKSFGVTWQYFPDILPKLAIRGTIFARMAPEQKTQLVELLQKQDYIVGMCGDGANDCGALKAAHIGISLSEAEASVAAPFTSKIQNIECVPTLIMEGRCALVTSFSVFKFMALCSIIQFISVLILYTFHVNLADIQFLYIDLVIITIIAVLMGYTGAHDVLVPSRPNGTLFGCAVLTSVFAQILLAAGIQIGAFLFLLQQTWFVPVNPHAGDKFTICYEESVIFCISCFQYLIAVVAFSKGRPFRKHLLTNTPLMLVLIVLTAFSMLLLIYPGRALRNFFQIMDYPNLEGLQFRLILIAFPVGHLISALLIELFINSHLFKRISHAVICKTKPKNLYKTLEHELQEAREWPPLGQLRHCS